MRPDPKQAAFTLLEVMVAIAILAMSLTAIFATEAGAIKMAHRSRKMGLATLLARCKMGEIEEQVAAEGLPAIDDSDSDACCEGAEIDGFSCDWEIKPIVLPETMFAPPEGEEGEEGASALGSAKGNESLLQSPTEKMQQELGSMDPNEVLSGGGTSGLAAAALGIVFPVLKPSFEQQIRRATVKVKWREGTVDHSFDVTQYLVSDQPILDPNAAPTTGTPPGTGTGTGTGTGSAFGTGTGSGTGSGTGTRGPE